MNGQLIQLQPATEPWVTKQQLGSNTAVSKTVSQQNEGGGVKEKSKKYWYPACGSEEDFKRLQEAREILGSCDSGRQP